MFIRISIYLWFQKSATAHRDIKTDEEDESSSNEDNESNSSEEDYDDESSENEKTFIEQENYEQKNRKEFHGELNELKNEADIPLEEVLKMYYVNDYINDDTPISESDTSSTSSQLSIGNETSSNSIDSISTMKSGFVGELNQLLIQPDEPSAESNKFKFSVRLMCSDYC